jgi:hypothetical protein
VRRLTILLLLVLTAAAPAQAAGPDHVASADVTHVQNIRTTGAGMGGGLHGDRLLVTGPSQLTVFDAKDPKAPALLGTAPLGNANESADVPSNGKWAAVAEGECLDPGTRGGCVAVFDVTGAPKRLASLGANATSVVCVLDCRYLWATGDNVVIDMADPAAPRLVGDFLGAEADSMDGPCWSAHESRAGLVMVSCDPAFAVSALAEHGGTPAKPVAIAQADTEDFRSTAPTGGVPHGARWPGGNDRFMMTTTETPFSGTCGGPQLGAFVLWDAQPVLAGGKAFRATGQWRPSNGTYTDGRSPHNAVGCSPHFLAEHPAFRNGGLVTVAALENGLRFLQVTPDGKIEERGYFLGLGGTAATPIWHPDGRTVYLIDYARGLDILDYSGPTYAPLPVGQGAPGGPGTPPAGSPGPAPGGSGGTPPARRFRVLGVIRNAGGRATLAVETPGPGRITATPRAKGARFKRLVANVRQGGLTTLTVVATGKAKKALQRRRRLAVDVRIAWKPKAGAGATARQRVVLRAKR